MSIEERGDEVNKRTAFGHWEIDTVVGKKESSVLLSLDKRLTRKRHLVKIPSRSSDAVRVGLEKIAKLYGESFETVFKSITSDNGSEFVDLGEARTKRKIILSLAFSQRENHWITLPMNKLRLSKVGSTICHARSSIATPLILFFNLSYLILQFRK